MRRLTTVIGLVLILAIGLGAGVGRPEPARAADGDNLVLVWNDQALESIRRLPPALRGPPGRRGRRPAGWAKAKSYFNGKAIPNT